MRNKTLQRRMLIGSLLAAFTLTFACTSAPPAPDPNALIDGAKKLDQQFLDAFNSRNVDAMAALYWNNPDVVSFQPDAMIAHGPAEIRAYYAKAMPALPAGAKLEITESHYMPQGDAVLAWGLYHFSFPGPDGKTVEAHGRFSDVKAERDGKWVYIMDHGSVPEMPAPAAPPAPEAK